MLSDADVTYIGRNFVPLTELCEKQCMSHADVEALIANRRSPRPSYTLDDGTKMVPVDYFELYEKADGGDVEELFRQRFAAHARMLGVSCSDADLADEWEAYLSGDYGVCLRHVTPENICAKGLHMTAIEQLLAQPNPTDERWRESLARRVDALDRLERQFAEFDRARWGPVSRDRLITRVRALYPDVFLRRELPLR